MWYFLFFWIMQHHFGLQDGVTVDLISPEMDQMQLNISKYFNFDSGALKLNKIKTNNLLRNSINRYKQMDENNNHIKQLIKDKSKNNSFFANLYEYMVSSKIKSRRFGRQKRSTDSKGFLDEPNNVAMFIVFPSMVFIYGGCAVIYCCYKCRNYVTQHRPLKRLKDKIFNRGKKSSTDENNMQTIDNPQEVTNEVHEETSEAHQKAEPEVKVFEKPVFMHSKQDRSPSAQSLHDSKVIFVDVEYEDETQSTMSTPLPLNNEDNEVVETPGSHATTDVSTYSFPSLSTVSTRVSTINDKESPVHKSVSVQSYSINSGHSKYPTVNLIDIGCQTDDNTAISSIVSKTVSFRTKIGKMTNRKKQNAKKKSEKPGQIHYVKRYVSLNPYRDQVEEDNMYLSKIKNTKANLYETVDETMPQKLKDKKLKRRKSNVSPIEWH